MKWALPYYRKWAWLKAYEGVASRIWGRDRVYHSFFTNFQKQKLFFSCTSSKWAQNTGQQQNISFSLDSSVSSTSYDQSACVLGRLPEQPLCFTIVALTYPTCPVSRQTWPSHSCQSWRLSVQTNIWWNGPSPFWPCPCRIQTLWDYLQSSSCRREWNSDSVSIASIAIYSSFPGRTPCS